MMSEDKGFTEPHERLNRYVEALNAEQRTVHFQVRDDEEAKLWQLARRLKVAARPERAAPGPQFAADLERRLLARQTALTQPRPSRSWRERTTSLLPRRAAVAVAGLLVVILFLVGGLLAENLFFRRPQLPSLASVAWAYSGSEGLPSLPGLLGEVSFELETSLPAAPGHLAVYQQASDSLTATEAEALASRFGILGEAHRVSESFIIEDENGRLAVHRFQRGYYRYQRLAPSRQPSLSLEDAEAAILYAETFMQQRDLLPFDYQALSAEPLPADEGPARYRVTFTQVVANRLVENAGVTVIVNEAGGVLEVTGRILALRPAGRYPIITAEKAYTALQENGLPQEILVEIRREKAGAVSIVTRGEVQDPRSFPPHQPGEHVQLEGLLSATIFEGADRGVQHVQAFLTTDPLSDQLPYRLIGPQVANMLTYDRLHLWVWGTVAVDDQGGPALIVEDYRRSRPEERFVTLLGHLVLDQAEGQEQLLLLTDDGTRYVLFPWGQDEEQIIRRKEEGRLGHRVLVGGTLTGSRSAEGYPIILTAGLAEGQDVAALTSADERPWPRPAVVKDSVPGLSGQAVITEVRLQYFALPVPADPTNGALPEELYYLWPVYRFTGHTGDETSFSLWVQAVRSD
jgi:hypothetical protein